jgi:hypothetical protein
MNLTSISTYGWWTGEQEGQSVDDKLTPISTYGWWVTIVTLGQPEIVYFDVYVDRLRTHDQYSRRSAAWDLER